MILILKFENIPPMPANRAKMLVSRPKPMYVKTPLARQFELDLTERLGHYSEDFARFLKFFNPKEHYLSADYCIYTPQELLFTKSGEISRRAVDADAHKMLMDTIFRCIGLDDKLVRDYRVYTPQSFDGNWNYVVKLQCKKTGELKCQNEELSLL